MHSSMKWMPVLATTPAIMIPNLDNVNVVTTLTHYNVFQDVPMTTNVILPLCPILPL